MDILITLSPRRLAPRAGCSNAAGALFHSARIGGASVEISIAYHTQLIYDESGDHFTKRDLTVGICAQ